MIVEKTFKLTDSIYRQLIDNPMTETFDFLKNQGEMKDADLGNQIRRSPLASQR